MVVSLRFMRPPLLCLVLGSVAVIACAPSQEAASPAGVAPATPSPVAPAQPGPTTLRGTLFGAPFAPVAACLTQARGDGYGQVEIYQANGYDVQASCAHLTADPEHRLLALEMPWKAGATFDLSTHRVSDGIAAGYAVWWAKDGTFRRKVINHDFKPTGTVEVLRAGARKGELARIKVTFVNGSETVEGEIDVYVPRDVPFASAR